MHGFREKFLEAEGPEVLAIMESLMIELETEGIADNPSFERANKSDDRKGVDFWITLREGVRIIGVDVKFRKQRPYGGDLTIEMVSVLRGDRVVKEGWTVDSSKITDYILYAWSCGTCILIHYPTLRKLCLESEMEKGPSRTKVWAEEFGKKYIPNKGYETVCIFVPTEEIERIWPHEKTRILNFEVKE